VLQIGSSNGRRPVSFDLLQVHKLKAQGGQVWDEYQRLVAAADQAMHGSPAHAELGAFQQAYEQDAAALTAVVEAKAKDAASAKGDEP
jgi:hypothetical protein